MEHHISIEKTINRAQPETECCIYKVHKGLRNTNHEAYTPMLVSIGPYHIEDTNLMAMKEKKLMYLHLLLKRRNVSQETYKLELAKLEERARQCYADPINYLESHEFVEMMLLDGCFIIGFLQELTSEVDDGDGRIINVEWMVSQICRDMMLLENQLPYFVLSTLYDMTIGPYQRRRSFWETLMVAFNFMLPKPRPRMIYVRQNYTQEIKHFLHVAHILCHYPLPEKVNTVNSDGNSDVTCQQRNTTENVDQRLTQPLIGSNSTSTEDEALEPMGCVVELQEAGVNFKKIGEVYNPVNLTKEENSSADDASLPALKEEKNVSLFEIRFENGSMKVPCFKVEDSTETLFRNLIAYEQHSSDNNSKYFTDFVTFMDQLINSEKDVEILRRNRIIVNLLGDDKMVSDLFSSLNKGIIESREFYYRGLCQRVNEHCKQKTNRFRAILTRDYLSTPCATASTFAAALLLILTIAQTIMALISLLKQ